MIGGLEFFIRIVFFIWSFISLIGFLWFAESRDSIENIFYILLITTLIFSTVKSFKSTSKSLYLFINFIGLGTSAFFGYKTIFVYKTIPMLPYILPNIVLAICFITLMVLSVFKESLNNV